MLHVKIQARSAVYLVAKVAVLRALIASHQIALVAPQACHWITASITWSFVHGLISRFISLVISFIRP
eukprot:9640204-Karenia_brevis.AAC.1